MTLDIDALQELPSLEVAGLAPAACCWKSTQAGCAIIPTQQVFSLAATTCHSCTNTG